jgi:hypothetical protein
MSLDFEVHFGEVACPWRSAMKHKMVYQGTTSVVPERNELDGLQPLFAAQGLKPWTERCCRHG